MISRFNRIALKHASCYAVPCRRSLWQWLNIVSNLVDESRIKEVGADQACAEWLLRNGASVKWYNSVGFSSDYNALPSVALGDPVANASKNLRFIEAINANNASVMDRGFRHLKGLNGVKSISLIDCALINDDALKQLHYVKESLQELNVSGCGDVTDRGIVSLGVLKKLQRVTLKNLPGVRDINGCAAQLQQSIDGLQTYI